MKNIFPSYFKNKRVLDIGSFNSGNRRFFTDCEYVGLDLIEGDNVDVVCIPHKYVTNELFDVIISTHTLEHDMHWQLTLLKIKDLLKHRGLLILSASNSWNEHGTIKNKPFASSVSRLNRPWSYYYRNITSEMLALLNFNNFEPCFLKIIGKDICFWGIKL